MDGYKDSTKMKYMGGGMVDGYAKGGSVKGAAKVGKVMGEFKAGKLHSGSKSGPTVTNPKQATAIAMSEARKAGAKMPMKKAEGGVARNRLPPIGDSVDSGNRMSKMEAKEERAMSRRVPGAGAMSEREMRQVKKSVPVASRLPLIGASVDSGNRMSRMDAADRAAVLRTTPRAKGGAMEKKAGGLAVMPKGASKNKSPVRKYAEGGAVSEQPYGQVTAAYGAKLRDQIKAGTMTNAQAQAAQNAFAKQEMARRTAADAKATAAKPMGQVTAAYGANLRDNIKAGTMTNAQAQAAHNAFVKQEMARRTAAASERNKTPPVTLADIADVGYLPDRVRRQPPVQQPMVRDAAYREGRDYTIDPRTGRNVPVRNSDPFGGSFGKLQPPAPPMVMPLPIGKPMPVYSEEVQVVTPPRKPMTPVPPMPPMPPMPVYSEEVQVVTPPRKPMTPVPPMPPMPPMPIQPPAVVQPRPPGFRMGGLAVTPRGGRY